MLHSISYYRRAVALSESLLREGLATTRGGVTRHCPGLQGEHLELACEAFCAYLRVRTVLVVVTVTAQAGCILALGHMLPW